jgi:acetyl esterase/lipase
MRRRTVVTVALALALVLALALALALSIGGGASPGAAVSYGPGNLQKVDVYPAERPGAPLVMLVHGGGWQSSDRAWRVADARTLQAAGATVMVANYDTDSSTAPAFPREPDDIVVATEWALAHAHHYNADPNRLVLLGGSAGSTLVGLATEQLNAAKPGTVKTVITLSGAMDFTQLNPLNATRARAVGCSSAPCTTVTEAKWSPADNVTPGNCPGRWIAFNSTKEMTPLPQAVTLVTALHANGCQATLIVRQGTAHSFSYFSAELGTIESAIAATR